MNAKQLHRKHRKARFSSKFRGKASGNQSSVRKAGEKLCRPVYNDDVDIEALRHVVLLETGEIEAKWYGHFRKWEIEVSLFPTKNGIDFVKTRFSVEDKEVYLTD